MSATRIVLVEDDEIIRDRFADLLGAEPDFQVAGAFGAAASARAFILREPLDVLLVDLGLPDADGSSLIKLCASVHPAAEIAVVTMFSDSERVFACLEAGATGYILKDEIPAGIVGSVRMLLAGGSPVSPSIARRLLHRLGAARQRAVATAAADADADAVAPTAGEALTPREIEILELVAKGLSVAQIGSVLAVSPHTVGTHVKNIYRKLSVHSRTEAVYEARGLGLLRP